MPEAIHPESTGAATAAPLCVDLDGTLILTDMLWESALALVRQHPLRALAAPVWLLGGRANLKRRIASNSHVDVATLPWNRPFLEWLKEQKAQGRRLILSTAAEEKLARGIANHLRIFDDVVASDGTVNLKGKNKARLLSERFGADFDYAGNSGSDREIWRVCRGIVAVETPAALTRELRQSGRIAYESIRHRPTLKVGLAQLRFLPWIGNVLLFVPVLVFSGAMGSGTMGSDTLRSRWEHPMIPALVGFGAFCAAASAACLISDLLDLPALRLKADNSHHPVATGDLSIASCAAAAIALTAAALIATAWLGWKSVTLLIFYIAAIVLWQLAARRRPLAGILIALCAYLLPLLAGGLLAGFI